MTYTATIVTVAGAARPGPPASGPQPVLVLSGQPLGTHFNPGAAARISPASAWVLRRTRPFPLKCTCPFPLKRNYSPGPG